MTRELDKMLMRSLRRLGFEGEELDRMYLLLASFPKPLALLILDQARRAQAPRRPKN